MPTVPAFTLEAGQLPDGPGVVGLGGWPGLGRQHLKLAGPGQRPVTVFPDSQAFTSLQVPPEVPQTGFVQHWTFLGSLGQNPGVDVPPLEAQEEVVAQMPGVPLAMAQGPFRAAYVTVGRMAKMAAI